MNVVQTVRAALVFLVVSLFAAAPGRAQGVAFGVADEPAVTTAEVEAALSPYGDWIEVSPWGRVWRPDVELVGEDFAPYLNNGRWIYGVYGWTFNSNYPWGWAAFHFGRWAYHPEQGWVWTARGSSGGFVWGPAWVAWRTGAGVVGWLPQLPAGAAAAEAPHQYASLWSVVPLRQFQSADLMRQLLPPERIANAKSVPPPSVGSPMPPLACWRGYPGLREALAAANGAVFVAVPPGARENSFLWTGVGSSVHAPPAMGQAVGASPLWTGPGSSVFASPADFGSPALGQRPRGWAAPPLNRR